MATKERPLLATDEELAENKKNFCDAYIMEPGTQIFEIPYCAGYWLFGVQYDEKLGWLALETGGEINGFSADHSKAEDAWMHGRTLPQGYFCLDRNFADRAFNAGCRMFGERWMDDIDLPRVDIILQAALLGEERYG